MSPRKKMNAPKVFLRVEGRVTLHHPWEEVSIRRENQGAVPTSLQTRGREEEDTKEMSCKGSLGRLSLVCLKVAMRKENMLKLGCWE